MLYHALSFAAMILMLLLMPSTGLLRCYQTVPVFCLETQLEQTLSTAAHKPILAVFWFPFHCFQLLIAIFVVCIRPDLW